MPTGGNDKRRDYEKELYEMHTRSQMPPVPPFVRTADSTEPPKPPPEEPPRKGGTLFGRDLLKLIDLKNFEMDSDRMLLLMMILLLSGEQSDEILLLALAYLML